METEAVKHHGRNKSPAQHGLDRCWVRFLDSLVQALVRAANRLHTSWEQSESTAAHCGSFSLPRPDSRARRALAGLALQLLGRLACYSGKQTVWEHLPLKAEEKKQE